MEGYGGRGEISFSHATKRREKGRENMKQNPENVK